MMYTTNKNRLTTANVQPNGCNLIQITVNGCEQSMAAMITAKI